MRSGFQAAFKNLINGLDSAIIYELFESQSGNGAYNSAERSAPPDKIARHDFHSPF